MTIQLRPDVRLHARLSHVAALLEEASPLLSYLDAAPAPYREALEAVVTQALAS